MIDPATAAPVGAILGFAVLYIMRERGKWKNEKSNNGYLEIIKEKMATKEQLGMTNGKIGKIDKTVGIINENVKNMKSNCEATTTRFEKAINGNRTEILSMAKKRK